MKFRIFDKDKGKFIEDLSDVWINPRFTHMLEWNPNFGYIPVQISDNLVFQHSIDKKDIHGKDIYEGDIVKCSYFKMSVGANLGAIEVDAELHGVIEFNDLSLCVTNIVGEKWSHYTGYGAREGSCEITYLHDVYEDSTECEMSIEVIGNIYEHAKLIK